jgi:hypothetical protein
LPLGRIHPIVKPLSWPDDGMFLRRLLGALRRQARYRFLRIDHEEPTDAITRYSKPARIIAAGIA